MPEKLDEKGLLGDFLKRNFKEGLKSYTKGIGSVFGVGAIVGLATAENKLKAIVNLLKDIMMFPAIIASGFMGLFGGLTKGIRTLIRDTGSLQTAVEKLQRIQELRKAFVPLLGGMEAAKKRMAELVTFASRFGRELEDVVEASRSLAILTNQTQDTVEVMKLVGDTAAATGSQMSEVADAVGEFYHLLRTGTSVESATNQLVALGAISSVAADELNMLQQSGLRTAEVFDSLKRELLAHNGAMESERETIAGVSARREKAGRALQEAFASPFVESEVENVKNTVEAMEALLPVAKSLGQFFATLTNGFTTLQTWFVKTAASIPGLAQAVTLLAQAITVLIAAVSALGALGLANWLIQNNAAAVALITSLVAYGKNVASAITLTGAFGSVLQWLATAAGIAAGALAGVALAVGYITAAIAVVGVLVAAWNMLTDAFTRGKKELEQLAKAYDEKLDAMDRDIKKMRTYQQQADLLTRSLKEQAEILKEIEQARMEGDKEKEKLAREAYARARDQAERIKNTAPEELEPLESRKELARSEFERRLLKEEVEYGNQMEKSGPEGKLRLMREREELLRKRAEAGRKSKEDSVAAEEEMAQKDLELGFKQREFDKARSDYLMEEEKPSDQPGWLYRLLFRETGGKMLWENERQALAARSELEKAEREAMDVGKDRSGKANVDWQMRLLASGRWREVVQKKSDGEMETVEEARARLQLEKEKFEYLEREAVRNEAEANRLREQIALMEKTLEYEKEIVRYEGELARNAGRTEEELQARYNLERNILETKKRIAGLRPGNEAEIARFDAEIAALEKSEELRKRRVKLAADVLRYEEELAGLSGKTIEDAKRQYDLTRKIFDAQKEMASLEEGGDQKAKEAANRKKEYMTQQRQMFVDLVRSRKEVQDEIGVVEARLKGDRFKAKGIEDFGVYADMRDRLLGVGYNESQANEMAKRHAANVMALQGASDAVSITQSTGFSDLARIGGGGNVGFGVDLVDIAKRQEELLRQIAENTKEEKKQIDILLK